MLALVMGAAAASPSWSQVASQGWQAQADVLSSGAAASIVAFHVCSAGASSQAAGQRAHGQLEQWASRNVPGAQVAEARHYLADATDRKVRAMWQVYQGKGCSQIQRLREMAQSTGFDAP